jgi:hypothetical protein
MNLCINNGLNFTVVELSEDWHYVVIDDFLANPDQLVEYGSRLRDEFLYPERVYSGGVLPLDGQVLTPVNQFIRGNWRIHSLGKKSRYFGAGIRRYMPCRVFPGFADSMNSAGT